MKKIILILVFCVVAVGCQSTGSKEYVNASCDAFAVIVPCYVSYVQSDEKLSDFDKKARIVSAQEALAMAQEEKVRVK